MQITPFYDSHDTYYVNWLVKKQTKSPMNFMQGSLTKHYKKHMFSTNISVPKKTKDILIHDIDMFFTSLRLSDD
jgi:hypothetical protein